MVTVKRQGTNIIKAGGVYWFFLVDSEMSDPLSKDHGRNHMRGHCGDY